MLQSNPAARIKFEKVAQAAERFLTHAEFDAIRAQLPTTDDQLVVDLLAYTGMRWSEMAGLHWSRIDLGRGVLRVVETYDETSGRMKPYPKGQRARDVPLTPELIDALVARRPASTGTRNVRHTAGICRSGLACTTAGGAPLRNSNWSPLWRHALEYAGVGHARIHDLRHTTASWLLQAGIPLAEVGRLLGHVSTQTTAKFAHLAEPPSAAILAALAAPREPHGQAS